MTGHLKTSLVSRFSLGAVVLLSLGCGPDWRAKAILDIDRMYESLEANHPGAVDRDNPQFRALLQSTYTAARDRAQKVEDASGYFYALRSFVIPFQDEHLKVNFVKLPARELKWPGFAVTWNEDNQVVVFRRDLDSAPPIGARLVSCDGKSVDQVAAERIKPFIGNWSLPAKRPGDAPFLLIDSQNPFVENPTSATFEFDDKLTKYQLDWHTLGSETLDEILDELEPTCESQTEFRELKSGVIWITISSFSVSNPDVKKEIDDLINHIQEHRNLIANAPAFVIDIRGNNGGSTKPGIAIAKSIWGNARIDRIRPRIRQVDWRCSSENLAALESVLPHIENGIGKSSRMYQEMSAIKDGMQNAIDSQQTFHAVVEDYPEVTDTAPLPVSAQTYFITDTSCVSAALDFADLILKIPGVTHVGLETAGDTRYLDTRNEMLPGALAQLTFPSSIHRGRERQDNQSYQPHYRWHGSIADTKALEKWIEDLSGLGE